MKITVELNDDTLRKSIGDQLSATVSRLVHEQIEKRVEEVMGQKLDRADSAIQKAADAVIERHLSTGWSRDNKLKGYFESAATKIMLEKLKS